MSITDDTLAQFLSKYCYILDNRTEAGGFSYVFFAETKDQNLPQKIVIKLRKSKQLDEQREIKDRLWTAERTMSEYNWPNKVHIIGCFQLLVNYQNHNFMKEYILMEQCEYNLEDYLYRINRELSISEIWWVLAQTLEALVEANNCKIFHRDLKPENLLLRYIFRFLNEQQNSKIRKESLFNFQIKVGDWGLCKIIPDKLTPSTHTVLGTDGYKAPEINIGNMAYGPEVDIYSLGMIATNLFHKKFQGFKQNGKIDIQTLNEWCKKKSLSNYSSSIFNPQCKYYYLSDVYYSKFWTDHQINFKYNSFICNSTDPDTLTIEEFSDNSVNNHEYLIEFIHKTACDKSLRFGYDQITEFAPMKPYIEFLRYYFNPLVMQCHYISALIRLLDNVVYNAHIHHLAVYAAVDSIKMIDSMKDTHFYQPLEGILNEEKSKLFSLIKILEKIAEDNESFIGISSPFFEKYRRVPYIPNFIALLYEEIIQLKEKTLLSGRDQLFNFDICNICLHYAIHLIQKKIKNSVTRISDDTLEKLKKDEEIINNEIRMISSEYPVYIH